MVPSAFIPAIKEAIKTNEIGNGSPYVLSYAKLGASGASFGIFQGDTNVNPTARATLSQVLQAAHADAGTVKRILDAVSKPCPQGNPLSPADTKLVNDALGSGAGRASVDKMDAVLLDAVLGHIDSCIQTCAAHHHTLAPIVHLHIALWTNMTGTPSQLNQWLGGQEVNGVPPPTDAVVGAQWIEAYLQATKYFQDHPQNFLHFLESVKSGAKLLPH